MCYVCTVQLIPKMDNYVFALLSDFPKPLDQAHDTLATALGVYVDDALGSLEVDL